MQGLVVGEDFQFGQKQNREILHFLKILADKYNFHLKIRSNYKNQKNSQNSAEKNLIKFYKKIFN